MSEHPRPPHHLDFVDLGRKVGGIAGETVFQSARRNGVRIVGACGGRGTCGTCMVRIAGGGIEHHPDEDGSHGRSWLRACRITPRTDCAVEIAPRSLAAVVRAETEGEHGECLAVDARIVAVDVQVPPATLADPTGDTERMARALDRPVDTIELTAARQLPELLRRHDGAVRVRLRGDSIIGFSAVNRPLLGLAVDLGTTNAAAFLLDLESGRRLAGIGIENPQVAWGADVISRINHAIRAPAGGEELRLAILGGLNALAHDLCHAVGADRADIIDAAICGNTAMHHLLAGLPVHQLGRAPFVAAVSGAMEVGAAELGLDICPGARVHLVANVGGFVGGDHVTALLATESRWSDGTSLVMDIGTNTEISLIHDGVILSASSPSGPALEGGHISCGMRAAEGAIERVAVVDGRIVTGTIGDKPAIGLCGSGVLDAVASLLGTGMVDRRGRLSAAHADVISNDGQLAARLTPGVVLTQEDIRAVQLAKAAIRTATDLLLDRAGLAADDIRHFIIAGAFGQYIDIASGIAIGLLPALPPERFEQVGNAAGLGVRRILLSRADMRRSVELAARCQYVDMSGSKEFQKKFMSNIALTNGETS